MTGRKLNIIYVKNRKPKTILEMFDRLYKEGHAKMAHQNWNSVDAHIYIEEPIFTQTIHGKKRKIMVVKDWSKMAKRMVLQWY